MQKVVIFFSFSLFDTPSPFSLGLQNRKCQIYFLQLPNIETYAYVYDYWVIHICEHTQINVSLAYYKQKVNFITISRLNIWHTQGFQIGL